MTTATIRNNSRTYGKDLLQKFRNFAGFHPVLAFALLTFLFPAVMLGAVSGSMVLIAIPFIFI